MRTNKTKLTIFCSTLALFAASCEKQNDYPMVSPLHTDTTNEYLHICYSIDGGMYQPVRCTPAELDAILNDLLTLVRNGHSISIFNSNTFRNANTKEVVVKHFSRIGHPRLFYLQRLRIFLRCQHGNPQRHCGLFPYRLPVSRNIHPLYP